MRALSEHQKSLLFDYSLGLTSGQETVEAESLVASDKEAEEFVSKIRESLSPLDSLEVEVCPADLAERTVSSLIFAAEAGQSRLEQLLEAEQAQTIRPNRFWNNVRQVLTTAAVILLVAGVFTPTLYKARRGSWEQRCTAQMMRMGKGINNYRNDNDSLMPAVAMAAGAPWWKVGYQGNENHSNTRHLWLLVKGNYVSPTDFVCPGRRQGRAVQFNVVKVKQLSDFPARRYITYSSRVKCNKSKMERTPGQSVLIADMNPLFEKLPHNDSDSLKIHLNNVLSNANSSNHNRRGQNVLFCDGAVKFAKKRNIGIAQDDIYTVQGTDIYKGVETPSHETDDFLAP
ncbi:hypothetical protein ACFL3G_09985 [Planctomycetota bacterium]